LGTFDHFFFYLVLDNVKSLFKVERQKRVLEKLAISQIHLEPKCYSMVVISDCLGDEIEIFGTNTNVFSEFMFYSLYFSPFTEEQFRSVIHGLLYQHYNTDDTNERMVTIRDSLSTIYNDFFLAVHNELKHDTVNINEYSYFYLMLIEPYLEPALEHMKNPALFKSRLEGRYLNTTKFRKFLALMCQNIYLHVPSKDDL
jgi:hypothetical protein